MLNTLDLTLVLSPSLKAVQTKLTKLIPIKQIYVRIFEKSIFLGLLSVLFCNFKFEEKIPHPLNVVMVKYLFI